MQLAMDKRTIDGFGRMSVSVSNISKAAVNPYRGSEIPNHGALGLDPDRVYMLLRDPAELAKAVETFNNLPVLSKHVPVTAEKPSQELIVGTTGTDAEFDEPYLRNSLSIWEAEAILGIKAGAKQELSSAYAYDADMTPGQYGGVKYDGVMRNIRGNHVALVIEGRAGPDVVVGDSKLLEKDQTMKLSPKGVALLGALLGYSATVIAQDAQIGDLRAIAGSVKDLGVKEQKAVVTAYTKLVDGKLADGMALDALPDLVANVAKEDTDIPPAAGAMDGDFATQLAALLEGKGLSPEVVARIQAMCAGGAMDEDPDDKEKDKVDKPAMDAAIQSATAAVKAGMLAVRNAEIEVQPVIGTLAVAQDDANGVYKLALDHMGVDLTDIAPEAYRSVFRAVRASAATTVPKPAAKAALAMDSANSGAKTFAQMFPGANKIQGGV